MTRNTLFFMLAASAMLVSGARSAPAAEVTIPIEDLALADESSAPSIAARSASVVRASVNPTNVSPASVNPTNVSPASVNPTNVRPTSANPANVRPTSVNPTGPTRVGRW
ncbi:hypothetical protein [Polyangium aurulentum]|uniref:hypothetical protein n=1 Tax=Polyangium aurulentum TaxID=2567896 RepID=UPI0010AED661|nr:hypothetical protein [Polyangium aurulentum]UQA55112.1 hypothetical protein E8A73_027605 [Polyangium aurulentum]